MPSSGNGSAIHSVRRAGRDRERRGVLDRVRGQPRHAVRLPHRDRRGQARREHQAGADLELHPDRLASRAAPCLHDAAQGTLVGFRDALPHWSHVTVDTVAGLQCGCDR